MCEKTKHNKVLRLVLGNRTKWVKEVVESYPCFFLLECRHKKHRQQCLMYTTKLAYPTGSRNTSISGNTCLHECSCNFTSIRNVAEERKDGEAKAPTD